MSSGISAEQRQKEEECDQDMAHIKTHLDLFTKHLLSGKTEKVKPLGHKVEQILILGKRLII